MFTHMQAFFLLLVLFVLTQLHFEAGVALSYKQCHRLLDGDAAYFGANLREPYFGDQFPRAIQGGDNPLGRPELVQSRVDESAGVDRQSRGAVSARELVEDAA